MYSGVYFMAYWLRLLYICAVINNIMQVPSFSFVRFSGSREVLPVQHTGDISFQVVSEIEITSIALCDLAGAAIETSGEVIQRYGNLYYIFPVFDRLPGCFRIALLGGEGVLAVSSTVFSLTDSKYTAHVAYYCEEDGFDFSYCPPSLVNRVRLPLLLKEPQFPQSQTVYDKRNGRRKLLSASISKEWGLETDYLPEEVHEKIIVALSHDAVYIDGELLTKTGDYSIDYGGIVERSGVKYMKGSCKVSANRTHRNSNCGDVCETEGDVFDVRPRALLFN
jgi:hypothetical protein